VEAVMAERSGGVVPEGDGLRRAMRWLDERAREDPRADRAKLVGEAALRFDLTPLDADFLVRNWRPS
jgi:hypothetical protein